MNEFTLEDFEVYPVINKSVFSELLIICDNDFNYLEKLFSLFQTQYHKKMSDVLHALTEKNQILLHEYFHLLKGSSATVGAYRLSMMFQCGEKMTKQQDAAESLLEALVVGIEACFEVTSSHWLNKISPKASENV